MSVHTTLVAPTLDPDQLGIDGAILHRLYKNKPVYIRPDTEILKLNNLDVANSEKRSSVRLFWSTVISDCVSDDFGLFNLSTNIFRSGHLVIMFYL